MTQVEVHRTPAVERGGGLEPQREREEVSAHAVGEDASCHHQPWGRVRTGSLTAVCTWGAGRAPRSQPGQSGALLTPESVFGTHLGGQREDRWRAEGRHLAGGKRPRM